MPMVRVGIPLDWCYNWSLQSTVATQDNTLQDGLWNDLVSY